MSLDNTYSPHEYFEFPRRSHHKWIDEIKDIITGKTFCEIGCASGWVTQYVYENYTKDVIGVEFRKNAYEYCLQHVDCLSEKNCFYGDATQINIPQSDVFYMWLGDFETCHGVVKNILKYNKNTTIIMAFCDKQGEYDIYSRLLKEPEANFFSKETRNISSAEDWDMKILILKQTDGENKENE
jgi:SAM-dependent methyltransferase